MPETGAVIVIAVRLLVPLLIFRWRLFGGLASMIVDALDVVLIDAIGLGGFGGHYHQTDKVLDMYYLAIEFGIAARTWSNPWERWPAVGLFVFRAIGAVLFEITQERIVLFMFPNLFENWWLYVVVVRKWWPGSRPKSMKTTAIPLLLLLIPKMGQEYLLHYSEAQPWNWTKENILSFAVWTRR